MAHTWTSWIISPTQVCISVIFFVMNSMLLVPHWAGSSTNTPTQRALFNLLPLFIGGRTSPILNLLRIRRVTMFRAHLCVSLMALASAIVHAVTSTARKPTDSILIMSGTFVLASLVLSCLFAPWRLGRFRHGLLLLHKSLSIYTVLSIA